MPIGLLNIQDLVKYHTSDKNGLMDDIYSQYHVDKLRGPMWCEDRVVQCNWGSKYPKIEVIMLEDSLPLDFGASRKLYKQAKVYKIGIRRATLFINAGKAIYLENGNIRKI